MDPDSITALKGQRKASFGAIQVDLPDDTVMRLCSGGFVTFDVDGDPVTFDSEDSDFGTFGGYSSIRDGTESQIVSASVTLYPRTGGLAILVAAGVQRSRVRIWEGVVSADTGEIEGEPDLVFIGEVDYPRAPRGRNTGSIILECSSQEYFQQVPDDQQRLNDAWLRSVWGNDVLGLRYVRQVAVRKVYWHMESPRGAIRYGWGGGGLGDELPHFLDRLL